MKNTGKAAIVIGTIGTGIGVLLLLGRKAEVQPGNIILGSLTISPAEVYIGERVEISVMATNIGEETATREIVCEVT